MAKSRISAAILMCLALSCLPRAEPSSVLQQDVELYFCQFSVSEPFKSGYADFSVVVRFHLSIHGEPSAVELLKNPARIDPAEVVHCIERWKLPKTDSAARASASFVWRHGIGWSSLSVHSEALVQKIYLDGG